MNKFCCLFNKRKLFFFIYIFHIFFKSSFIIKIKGISKFYNNNRAFEKDMREKNKKNNFVNQTKEFIHNLSYSNYSIYCFIMRVKKIIICIFF